MADWGSVPDWVMIGGAVAVFIGGQIVTWTLVAKKVGDNSNGLNQVKTDLEQFKEKAVTAETLAVFLEKAEANARELAQLRADMMSTQVFELKQHSCQGMLLAKINENAHDTEAVRQDIRDIKNYMQDQTKGMSDLLVAVSNLATKLDERTGKA